MELKEKIKSSEFKKNSGASWEIIFRGTNIFLCQNSGDGESVAWDRFFFGGGRVVFPKTAPEWHLLLTNLCHGKVPKVVKGC